MAKPRSSSSRRRRLPENERRRVAPGVAPGTITIDPEQTSIQLTVIAFDEQTVVEKTITDPAELRPLLERWKVVWLDVAGLGHEPTLRQITELFGLHRLALEDIVNTHQRPKAELYGNHYFIVTHMIGYEDNVLRTEQISLVVGKNWVLTFQEDPGDCFDPVRERIRKARGPMRTASADYLGYALLDVLIDHIFPVLENYSDRFDHIEEQIMRSASMELIDEIRVLRRELHMLRRLVWPLRDAVNAVLREPEPVFSLETVIYLRDSSDHAIRLVDLVETYRELAAGLLDMHMTMVSHRMNAVVQILTIITAIFIPLSFLTGLYGMNFNRDSSPFNMPELDSPYGYPILLGVMATIAITLLVFFRRRGWFAMASERNGNGLPGKNGE